MANKKLTNSKSNRRRREAPTSSSTKRSPRARAALPQSDPQRKPFTPENLDKTVIAIPLLNTLKEEEVRRKRNPRLKPEVHPVIIDLNLEFPGGREGARDWVINATNVILKAKGTLKDRGLGINYTKSAYSEQYLFARLEARAIRDLVKQDSKEKGEFTESPTGMGVGPRAIYHIWPDFKLKPFISRSLSTVKADAARISFSAFGEDIVWAVLDSGIEGDHPHFKLHNNLKLRAPLKHEDFTVLDGEGEPLADVFGHGTHVAGIIAGEMPAPKESENSEIFAYSRQRDENGDITYQRQRMTDISGMAPKCKLVSFKVLDDEGAGETSSLIAAISRIQRINGHGRRILVHGVNLSLGYQFEPEWFACGQSPLCVEVDRLVRSGVVVVVAAGNSGYGQVQSEFYGHQPAGLDMTIDDPGNAELAITVGATHRDAPHIYGVSYFSSKGPTGDGRAKPDIVAPGEKILSCAAGDARKDIKKEIRSQLKAEKKAQVKNGIRCDYLEESGTSMATPHVSGVIAAFLSVRREFIGKPDRVKEIFLSTATDLKREKYFQGNGLVDLMRAIQSV